MCEGGEVRYAGCGHVDTFVLSWCERYTRTHMACPVTVIRTETRSGICSQHHDTFRKPNPNVLRKPNPNVHPLERHRLNEDSSSHKEITPSKGTKPTAISSLGVGGSTAFNLEPRASTSFGSSNTSKDRSKTLNTASKTLGVASKTLNPISDSTGTSTTNTIQEKYVGNVSQSSVSTVAKKIPLKKPDKEPKVSLEDDISAAFSKKSVFNESEVKSSVESDSKSSSSSSVSGSGPSFVSSDISIFTQRPSEVSKEPDSVFKKPESSSNSGSNLISSTELILNQQPFKVPKKPEIKRSGLRRRHLSSENFASNGNESPEAHSTSYVTDQPEPKRIVYVDELNYEITFTDNVKLLLESYTGQPWNWWPLEPPRTRSGNSTSEYAPNLSMSLSASEPRSSVHSESRAGQQARESLNTQSIQQGRSQTQVANNEPLLNDRFVLVCGFRGNQIYADEIKVLSGMQDEDLSDRVLLAGSPRWQRHPG